MRAHRFDVLQIDKEAPDPASQMLLKELAIEDAPYITQNHVTPPEERPIPFSMTPAKVK